MRIDNFYEDRVRATAYATLGIEGTYAIAFRAMEQFLEAVPGRQRALDFGCGAGRSTRFLKELGFDAEGVDIAEEMVRRACELDPSGSYRVLPPGETVAVDLGTYDLVLVAWALDNMRAADRKRDTLANLRGALAPGGKLVLVASTPELYLHEWLTLSPCDLSANRNAVSGEVVRVSLKGVGDERPYEDILFTDADYRAVFADAGLHVIESYFPLGSGNDSESWLSELEIAPWVIYELEAI